MLRITTLKNCFNIDRTTKGIAKTFGKVFATHYTKIMCDALARGDKETLEKFSDLTSKKQFDGNLLKFSPPEIEKKLFHLYSGAGIFDEIAFIKGFNGFPTTKDEQQEISDYLKILETEKRKLVEVNFVALVDAFNKVHGFCIYHVFKQKDAQQKDVTIIHIRQAAMLEKNQGQASLMARYLSDLYPNAYYEANQRRGNPVALKAMLIEQKLLETKPPVLGYSDKYTGLSSKYNLSSLLYYHYSGIPPFDSKSKVDFLKKHKQISAEQQHGLGLKRIGKYWETESIPRLAFSPVTFFKDANSDDNFLDHKRVYLKQK